MECILNSNIKSPTEQNFKTLISFLNKNLRPNVEWSINSEYPVAFSGFNLNNIKFIEERGEIVSHALLKYLMIKTPVGLFKVAVIGSVVTDKNHQKKGLAHTLVNNLTEQAKKDNCDICILWSDLDRFYNKHGFELAGSEEHLNIKGLKENISQVNTGGSIFQDSKNIDPALILKLFSNHLVGSVRSIKEVASYLKIPNTNIYSLWSPDKTLQAYAIQGRGLDLPNVIHEWGGNVPHLTQLFQHIIQKNGPFQLITSSTATNLVGTIKNKFVCEHDTRTLGYIKILNTQNIHFKVLRWARVHGEYHLQTFSQGDSVYLRYKSKNYQLPNEQALTRLLWGPLDRALISNLPEDMQDAILKVFPLPMWIWGWDIA